MPSENDGVMIVLSSPSGAGKTTLVKMLSKTDNFEVSISHTTRQPRPNEIPDKDYYFVNEEEFKRLIKKYNGTDYNFDTVNVVSAGERDADATGAKGMSASKMRAFASVNDFTSFKQGLISGTKEKDAMKLFKDLKKGMGVNEAMAPEDDELRMIRENYHNNALQTLPTASQDRTRVRFG